MMYKVLKRDGASFTTDHGCVSLAPFSYADGGASKPMKGDALKLVALLIEHGPEVLYALRRLRLAVGGHIGKELTEAADQASAALAHFQ